MAGFLGGNSEAGTHGGVYDDPLTIVEFIARRERQCVLQLRLSEIGRLSGNEGHEQEPTIMLETNVLHFDVRTSDDKLHKVVVQKTGTTNWKAFCQVDGHYIQGTAANTPRSAVEHWESAYALKFSPPAAAAAAAAVASDAKGPA